MEAVGGIVGGLFASDAAGDAADAQQAATAASIGEQRRQYDLSRADNLPFLQGGTAGMNELLRLYGLSPGGGKTRDQFRQELMPAYMTQAGPAAQPGYWANVDSGDGQTMTWMSPTQEGAAGGLNEAGLNAAIEQAYAQQQAERQAQTQSPGFGSAFAPINAGDVQNEPGYQFGLQQGQTALDRKIAAMGGRVSGQALKAASRYNSDYATTRYGQAYDRKNQERADKLNRFGLLAGVGQTAVGQTTQAGQNSTNAITNLLSSQGDASGAARMAQGNIWGNVANQVGAAFGRKTTPTPANYATAGYGGFWE